MATRKIILIESITVEDFNSLGFLGLYFRRIKPQTQTIGFKRIVIDFVYLSIDFSTLLPDRSHILCQNDSRAFRLKPRIPC